MKKLKFRLQLVAEDEAAVDEEIVEFAVLEKDCKRLEQLGLTLAESKEIIGTLQQHVLQRQTATFVEDRRWCPGCGRRLGLKGHHTITFRTLLGDVALDSPRLRRCRCSREDTTTFSPLTELLIEHTSPEPLYLQTKWSSLVSYGMTAKMLKDVLPVDEKLSAATVRNHALEIARRSEEMLGEERVTVPPKEFCTVRTLQTARISSSALSVKRFRTAFALDSCLLRRLMPETLHGNYAFC